MPHWYLSVILIENSGGSKTNKQYVWPQTIQDQQEHKSEGDCLNVLWSVVCAKPIPSPSLRGEKDHHCSGGDC